MLEVLSQVQGQQRAQEGRNSPRRGAVGRVRDQNQGCETTWQGREWPRQEAAKVQMQGTQAEAEFYKRVSARNKQCRLTGHKGRGFNGACARTRADRGEIREDDPGKLK